MVRQRHLCRRRGVSIAHSHSGNKSCLACGDYNCRNKAHPRDVTANKNEEIFACFVRSSNIVGESAHGRDRLIRAVAVSEPYQAGTVLLLQSTGVVKLQYQRVFEATFVATFYDPSRIILFSPLVLRQ